MMRFIKPEGRQLTSGEKSATRPPHPGGNMYNFPVPLDLWHMQ
jgi:hypothetical protein